ncbi:hypothetical protein A9404_10770 [Halothiobacillus diazotrophicus]|uniref:Uncharacterized protein n=1 Tax=Halothiobacillus diazotrophicus TaxID=1860122 RepID=A0A191ZIS6_9GAMM|nr:hypothetical protein [Halothiobacillus diazotrophicus]ANJ67796.1 hypothetical protein A9404_10770 [Halothiobacillus diazotrophicus]
MDHLLLLLAEVLTSLAISLAVLFVLSEPLMRLLGRICPDDQAVLFWVRYAKVMLVLAPLLLVLTMDLLSPWRDPIDNLRLGLIACLGGLLWVLHLVGKRLGRFERIPANPVERP